MIDELEGWYRVGGHRLQFFATDAEIAEWLRETVPPAYAPYSLVGREWRDGRWNSFHYALSEIDTCFTRYQTPNQWIRSDVLSPGITGDDEKRASYTGLILVQRAHEREGKLEDASIAIVNRIRHERSGAERRADEYMRIFERLRRSMRKRLVVETVRVLPGGSTSKSWRMTARAAEAHTRGDVTFAVDPVGLRP